MKKDKSKKDKIRQGNLRDFDLLYDTLLSGGTYSGYRSELLDRSMPQELLNFDISEDDILAAWILGKDEESELYARGGHIAQFGPDSNWYAKGKFDSTKGAFQGAGNSIMSGLGIASTLGGWAGDFVNSNNEREDANEKINANLRDISSQTFGVGDTGYLASQYNGIQRALHTSAEDNGAYSTEEGLINLGKDALSGAMTGLSVGGPWGALVGGVVGLGKAGILWATNNSAAREQAELNNLKADIANNQTNIRFGDTVSNSNKLYLWNQLSQPYMAACGGKMKNKLASGGYINSHYDYITDPLVRVEAGGTHQENPNEGVLTSMAPDGKPNLVELGETIIDNGLEDAYVFSDRIVADEEILKSHLLPVKFAGKTYADISKELDKIIEEHKNDEISKRTFDEMISRLQQAQEDQKFQEKQEEVEKFLDGLTDEQKEQLEQTMVEEAQAEQQAAEEQAIAEQQAQELAAAEQEMSELTPEQTPEQVAMEQPEEQIVPSRYDLMMSRALFADAADLGMFAKGGHLHQENGSVYYINGYDPYYDGALIYQDDRNWVLRNIYSPIRTYFGNLSQRAPEFTKAVTNMTPVGAVVDIAEDNTDNVLAGSMPVLTNGPWIRPGGTKGMYMGTKGLKVVNSAQRSTNRANATYHTTKPATKAGTSTESALRASELAERNLNEALRIEQENAKRGLLWGYNAETGVGQRGVYSNQVASKPPVNKNFDYRYDIENSFGSMGDLKIPFASTARNREILRNGILGGGLLTALGAGIGLTALDNGDIVDENGTVVGKQLPDGRTIMSDQTNWRGLTLYDDSTAISSELPGYERPLRVSSLNTTGQSNNNIATNRNNTPQRMFNPGVITLPESTFDGLPVDYGYTNPNDRIPTISQEMADVLGSEEKSIPEPTKKEIKEAGWKKRKDGTWYKKESDGTTTDYSTWLRYAPAIGSGIQYLSDLFGVTNRNDYTNPNLFQRSINLIPNVGFTPLGGYKTFNPFDETYQQNALRSMNEAARRAVINNSNGNYGATLAALNALNYNTSGQFGDLALKAREYNDKERQAIDEYNLKINQINASLSMNAQEKNQAIAALKARLTAALAEMRQQIEDTNDAAKSANMTNFYQNLGNVGKENFNMTMVRSNPAFYYTITNDGHILYKNGFDGLNERDQAFVRSVALPQAEEQRKKHLEEANKKADLTTNKQSDYGLLIGGRNPFSRYGSFGNFGNY